MLISKGWCVEMKRVYLSLSLIQINFLFRNYDPQLNNSLNFNKPKYSI